MWAKKEVIFLLLVLVRRDWDSPRRERESEKERCWKTIFTHRHVQTWTGSRITYFWDMSDRIENPASLNLHFTLANWRNNTRCWWNVFGRAGHELLSERSPVRLHEGCQTGVPRLTPRDLLGSFTCTEWTRSQKERRTHKQVSHRYLDDSFTWTFLKMNIHIYSCTNDILYKHKIYYYLTRLPPPP